MVIYVDVDETICITPGDASSARDYSNAEPIKKNIETCNRLYNDGHEIVYWTARGCTTGLDWREITEKQFKEWGVKYHDLKLDKPFYDIFIDDKNINSDDFFQLEVEQISESLKEE